MKQLTLTLLTLALFHGMALGQIKNFDKEAFLIGTLDDYMGHQQAFTANSDSFNYQKVDIYFQSEIKLALLIDSLFKADMPDLRITNSGAPKGVNLYSPILSEKVNRYFTYEPSGMRTIYGDTIYSGSLKKEVLTGAEKRMSFLAGTYLRYGQLMDEKDAQELFGEDFGPDFKCISIANSRSKAQLCKDLLLAEGCKEVKYLVEKNYIPTGHWIFFKPSKAVLKMIDRVTALKKTWE